MAELGEDAESVSEEQKTRRSGDVKIGGSTTAALNLIGLQYTEWGVICSTYRGWAHKQLAVGDSRWLSIMVLHSWVFILCGPSFFILHFWSSDFMALLSPFYFQFSANLDSWSS